MNLILTLMLCASAARVDGKGDHGAASDGLSIETPAELEARHYKDTRRYRGNASTGSRDDGIVVKRQVEDEPNAWMDGLELESRGTGRHLATGSRDDGHEIMDAKHVDDGVEQETYGVEWEFKNTSHPLMANLGLGDEVTVRLERHLSEQVIQETSLPKKSSRGILKGQSNSDLEEEQDADEYEYDEVILPESRGLAKAGKRARKNRGKAKKKKKNGKKKGKKGNNKGKYKNKANNLKKQAGKYKNSNNYQNNDDYFYDDDGVFNFGDNGVVGNTQHNNLFNDNNRRAICLQPPDPYRTCFQRAEDPNNKLNKNYIDRSGYNFGIKLYRQGYTYVQPYYSDPAYNTPLEPYSKPYTTADETLYSTTMWLTLLQDNTNVNCAAQIDIEEATLKFLYDNVGSPSTFKPVCVFVKNSAYDQQETLDGSGDRIESTVLALDITFVMNKSFKNQRNRELGSNERVEEAPSSKQEANDEDVNDHQDRELAGRRCRPQDRAICSSQVAINSRLGQSCRSKGCRIGRPRPGGSLVNSNSFNSVVNAATPFNPAQTNSLLDMQDIDLVATCSTNRYAKEMENAYTLTCTQFDDYGCKTQNDDLTPMLTERNGCRSDSYFPTVFPTGGFPTSFPTSFPTIFPSLMPTSSPTVSPTLHPTFTPSSIPTLTPSLIPTGSPSLYPTHHPTLSPTLEPTLNELDTKADNADPTLSPSELLFDVSFFTLII
ncbi:hypothetical protein ACHAWX_006780 [Stephanocyclus meneghinianus]